ncbi:fimbria/pilus outer membrane usher protein [Sulfitobacter sp. S190]|uniref:fimbria/pilus outer membrane usher protein n=1 Tax=Sulfitobacter sp. S190 TaxID=2867022 RepID=UPI0021A499EF|nr:fimbria/pilus outer membrane usher protein [Sulfitobacter sp. S190]UWR24300.1 fimbria/pilus outer membrane usher protein [Sulfitobacter sp. S190]
MLSPDPSFGMALNYDLNLRSGKTSGGSFDLEGASIGIEAWTFWNNARLRNTGLLSLPVGRQSNASWTRFSTALEIDYPKAAVIGILGDTLTSSLSWGRPVRLGGLRIHRDFALRRDLVRRPLPAFEGSVAVPSGVDVFIEGNRVFDTEVQSGDFTIEDIPVVNGAGTAIVSLRGEDGTVTRTELSFFGARNLLAPGVADWSVEIGYPRLSFGNRDSSYVDDLVFNGTIRRGITPKLTLEAQLSATRNFRHVAVGQHAVVGNLAEVSFSLGHSRHNDTRGKFYNTTLIAHPLNGRLRFEASHFRASGQYLDLASAIDAQNGFTLSGVDRRRDVVSLSVPGHAGEMTFGASHISIENDTRKTQLTSLGLSSKVWRSDAVLNVNASHDWTRRDTRLAAVVTMKFGKHATQIAHSNTTGSSVFASRAGDGTAGSWGYDAELARNDGEVRVGGRIWAQGRRARLDVSARHASRRSSLDLRLRGAFAMMDRRITAGPQIKSSFAVVDVGAPDVPVRLQNRVVTRTNRSGRAVVTGVQPYNSNRISIDVDDVAQGTIAQVTAADIVPSRTSGIFVALDTKDAAQTRVVKLQYSTGKPVPVGSALIIGGKSHDLGVGYDGLVLLDGVPEGATMETGRCKTRVPPLRTDDTPAVAICG